MATLKTARVTSTIPFLGNQQSVRVALENADDFAYEPGKYIIVDSQIPLANGKTIKRAYSIFAFQDHEFSLAAQALGPGSAYMNQLQPGAELKFSGPWGKLTYQPEHAHGQSFLFASDSGITAMIGLLQETTLASKVSAVYWLQDISAPFLSENFVLEHLPPNIELRIITLAHSDNIAGRNRVVDEFFATEPFLIRETDSFYLAGDGVVLTRLVDHLHRLGVGKEQVVAEYFFRKP